MNDSIQLMKSTFELLCLLSSQLPPKSDLITACVCSQTLVYQQYEKVNSCAVQKDKKKPGDDKKPMRISDLSTLITEDAKFEKNLPLAQLLKKQYDSQDDDADEKITQSFIDVVIPILPVNCAYVLANQFVLLVVGIAVYVHNKSTQNMIKLSRNAITVQTYSWLEQCLGVPSIIINFLTLFYETF